jgi:hypothetical protein
MTRQVFLRARESELGEMFLEQLVREAMRSQHLVGHTAPRVDPAETVNARSDEYRHARKGYPEPLVVVQRVCHHRARILSFPDGEVLSEPMPIDEACALVNELLAS